MFILVVGFFVCAADTTSTLEMARLTFSFFDFFLLCSRMNKISTALGGKVVCKISVESARSLHPALVYIRYRTNQFPGV